MTRFALFGAGLIGKVHANNIAAHPRAALQYVYDINTEAAGQVASRLGAHVASTPEEIWTADDVDTVLIASSTNTHADLLSRAIQTHKPAYCEKPIDLNMERVKAVVQEAYHSNVPIMIGFSRRFDSNHLGVREAIQDGAKGDL
jgi:myo-inositol 2-dehydrogenase/D-chiro-inositol 1-dehydrogenase